MNPKSLNRIVPEDLKLIIHSTDGVCVSLVMPVQMEPDKRSENLTRLKNLIGNAEEQLENGDLRRPDIDKLLAPARELTDGGRFTANKGEGLAVYLTSDYSNILQLARAPKVEEVLVSEHFLIRPLVPFLTNNRFYILALSQNDIRLLQADGYVVERMAISDLPQNISQALHWDDAEKQLQWHSSSGAATKKGRAAMFHGHGVSIGESEKDDILRYFQMLDKGVSTILADDPAPLVLAGVDYLLPIYKEANSYPDLIEVGIEGSQDRQSDEELHQAALEIMKPFFHEDKKKTLAKYSRLIGNDRASNDLEIIVPAAHQGRVDRLMVDPLKSQWGRYMTQTQQVTLNDDRRPEDEELLNLTIVYTIMNGGNVYALPAKELPDEKPMAATFRY